MYFNGDNTKLFSTVYWWFTKFSSGHESVKDALYSGRHKSTVTECNINKIVSVIEKDAHFRQVTQITNLKLASIQFILKENLKFRKISAHWIPRLLTRQ